LRRSVTQDDGQLAALPEIEAVERLVCEQQRMRGDETNRQHRALALPLREVPDRHVETWLQLQSLDDRSERGTTAAEEIETEVDRPAGSL
jgi:hypothetical protein